MKRALIASVIGVALAVAAYAGVFYTTTAPSRAELCCAAPELAWLTNEFKLDDAQVARVSALHAAYLAKAKERCRRMMALNASLRAMMAETGEITPEIEKGMNEIAQLRGECQREMFHHFVEVSHAMAPEEGRRYLTWALDQTLPCRSASNSVCPLMTQ